MLYRHQPVATSSFFHRSLLPVDILPGVEVRFRSARETNQFIQLSGCRYKSDNGCSGSYTARPVHLANSK